MYADDCVNDKLRCSGRWHQCSVSTCDSLKYPGLVTEGVAATSQPYTDRQTEPPATDKNRISRPQPPDWTVSAGDEVRPFVAAVKTED